MPLLEVRGLTRSHYGVHAFGDVDPSVEAGCITGPIGPDGPSKAMRAVTNNPTLAAIDADGIGRNVSFVCMGLARQDGILLGLCTSIDQLTGFRAILVIFTAAVVGGLGSIPSAVTGALSIGIAEELSQLMLPPDNRTMVGFVVILLVLSFPSRGLARERTEGDRYAI
jgi:branched-chain amino acid transport system permease protein/neutral amino acid transport system permease protein